MPLGLLECQLNIFAPGQLEMVAILQEGAGVPPDERIQTDPVKFADQQLPTVMKELTAITVQDHETALVLNASHSDVSQYSIWLVAIITWGKDGKKQHELIRHQQFKDTMMSLASSACKDVPPLGQEELWETVCKLSASDVAAHPCLKQMHDVFEYYLKYPTTSLEEHVVCTMQRVWLNYPNYPDTVSPSMDAVEGWIDAVFAIAAELRLFFLVSFHQGTVKKPVLRHIVDLFLVFYIKTRREALQGSTPDVVGEVMATCADELENLAGASADDVLHRGGAALTMASWIALPQFGDCHAVRWFVIQAASSVLREWVKQRKP